jgi:signal transduction histidine kinase
MRAPLRSMRSFANVLIEEYGPKLDATAREYLERMKDSASRMDALITDVLSYSRVSSEEAALTPVNLDTLVHEIVEHYPQFQQWANAVEIISPLPVVCGSRALLTQCISNLLDNALKFVPAGCRPHVVIRANLRGERVRLWVEDNGIGIAPEYRNRIFGLFQRLHRPDQYPGTGVGLAIVKRAVERMRGEIGVESEPGQGSRFWIELPAAD